MNIAKDFFRRVLSENYDQEFDEVIAQFSEEKDLIALQLREPQNDSELENLKNLAKVHALGALLAAMTYLERQTMQFGERVGLAQELRRRPPWHIVSSSYLERFGIHIPVELDKKMHETRRLRNMAAHGRGEPTKADVDTAISAIEDFEKFLGTIDIKSVKNQVEKYLKEKDAQHIRFLHEIVGTKDGQ